MPGGTGSFVAVAGGAGIFVAVAWSTEGSVAEVVGCPVAEGAESFVAEGTAYSAAGSAESFGGTSLVDFAYWHPSPLCAVLHFCNWGNAVPMSIFLWPA